MMIDLDKLRGRFNAYQRRQELQHVSRTGSFNYVSRAGHPMRFVIFCDRLERFERVGVRFEQYVNRVDAALSEPISRIMPAATLAFAAQLSAVKRAG